LAALAGLVSDTLNNGMAIYEMGQAASAMERIVIEETAQLLGFDAQAGGFLTSGGTLANLTALLTARSAKVQPDVWTQGDQQQQLALLVSEGAHYCVDRAVRIMGWGDRGIWKVATTPAGQMDIRDLQSKYLQGKAKGVKFIAVIGSACTTALGVFDPLAQIADFAEANELWFHVDGAHGAALALSPSYRQHVTGLERADSVTMDFHKMLLTPALCTGLFFRDHRESYRTFQQQADYLMEWKAEDQWYNFGRRTFECTKLMLSLKVFIQLSHYGPGIWRDYVTTVCDTGQKLAGLIREEIDFELAVDPACNIVCFRYRPTTEGMSLDAINALNLAVREELLREGRHYIVQTTVKGVRWLRCTLTNPLTSESHLRAMLESVRSKAQQLIILRQQLGQLR
jgi:L-2,4-diaminobutyrate decarboxylase